MLLYFFLLQRALYHEVMQPVLARALRERSFAPCQDLCTCLLARNSAVPSDSLIRAIREGLPFDRVFWHGLVGECLVHSAVDIPRVQTAPDSLCCLLAPDHYCKPDAPRSHYAPIQKAHFGARDLVFGHGYFRPDHAGLNDEGDVAYLAEYLGAIDPMTWQPRDLTPLTDCRDEDERAEELAYARDCLTALVELYQSARERDLVVVCETVA
jgi:hypothetical protein